MSATESLKIYTVASFRHLHAVRLFQAQLRDLLGVAVLDWTKNAPSLGLPLNERRRRLKAGWSCIEAEQREAACAEADLMIYLGDSGKDTAVQVGMAKAIGTPVLGISGPLEDTGLMLHSAVALWVPDPVEALACIKRMLHCRGHGEAEQPCGSCPAERVCTLAQ